MAGWSDIGLWTDAGIFDLPLSAPAFAGFGEEVECYDRQWRPLPDVGERCRAERAALERMAEECQRFLRARRRSCSNSGDSDIPGS